MKEEKTHHLSQHQQYVEGEMGHFFSAAPTHTFSTTPAADDHQGLFSSGFTPQYDVSMILAMGAHALPGGAGGGGFSSASVDTARWPRQETLTLLEVRARLDSNFKEANHKGPLWDQLSRIMYEEHGYQRSGKKCREKFENLYKYYKKTRDGKAGRHDGKNYRFFRQLEALYGESSNNNTTTSTNHLHMINGGNNINTIHMVTNEGGCNLLSNQDGFQSVSLSNHSPPDFDYTSSSEADKGGSTEQGESSMDMMVRSRRSKRGVRGWKEKMKEFIESEMRKMMDKQEAWLENMVRTIEHKEKERVYREEEWRRQETQRMEREHKFWVQERAWIEARDKALIDVLHRIIASKEEEGNESELESGVEKANKDYCSNKRKVNWRPKSTIQTTSDHFSNDVYKHGEMDRQGGMEMDAQEKGNAMNESCLRMLLGDGGNQKSSMGSELWS